MFCSVQGVVCTLHEGDDFGKLALVNDAPRAASIVLREDNCHFLRVDKEDFNRILRVRMGKAALSGVSELVSFSRGCNFYEYININKLVCSMPNCGTEMRQSGRSHKEITLYMASCGETVFQQTFFLI